MSMEQMASEYAGRKLAEKWQHYHYDYAPQWKKELSR